MSVPVACLKVSPRICGVVPRPKSECQLARIGLGVRDQFRNRSGGNGRRNHHHVRPGDQGAHRRQRPGGIEVEIGIEGRRIDDVRTDEKQGVAVGGCGRHRLGPDRGAGAGPVLDDHALAEASLQMVSGDAGECVDRRAGGEWHDHLYDLARIDLGPGHVGAEHPRHQHGGDNAHHPGLHRSGHPPSGIRRSRNSSHNGGPAPSSSSARIASNRRGSGAAAAGSGPCSPSCAIHAPSSRDRRREAPCGVRVRYDRGS